MQSGIQRGKPTKTLSGDHGAIGAIAKRAIAFTWGNNSCCTASQKSALHGSSWARCVVSIASINTYTAGGSCRRWVSEVSAGQTGILCAQNSPSSKTASGRSSAVASPVVKIHTRREFFNRSLFPDNFFGRRFWRLRTIPSRLQRRLRHFECRNSVPSPAFPALWIQRIGYRLG